MSTNGSQKRTRQQRVATIEVQRKGFWQLLSEMRRYEVLVRLGLSVIGALVVWLFVQPWNIPFTYYKGYIPQRDILSTVSFEYRDPDQFRLAKDKAADSVPFVFNLNPQPIENLIRELKTKLVLIADSESYSEEAFEPFVRIAEEGQTMLTPEEQYTKFKMYLTEEGAKEKLEKAIDTALSGFVKRGILHADNLPREPGKSDEYAIISPDGNQELVKVTDLLLGDGSQLQEKLSAQIEYIAVADHVFTWLLPRLQSDDVRGSVLILDNAKTQEAKDAAVALVEEPIVQYTAGQTLAKRGEAINDVSLVLLQIEHAQINSSITSSEKMLRCFLSLGLIFALFGLCGFYIFMNESKILESIPRLSILLGMAIFVVGTCHWIGSTPFRTEIVPLLLFAMLMCVAYKQDLSMLLSTVLCLMVVFVNGLTLNEFIVNMGVIATAVSMLARIRSRTKLVTVGFTAAFVGAFLRLCVGTFTAEPMETVFEESLFFGAVVVITGFFMSGALPFIEKRFGLLTDMSLLELGDVSHPLLQELVRRAPGTYNHSINVASLGEAAADAIGANGLLVRVGAYFHDIGKMFKPNYFVENTGPDSSRHESLVPAMSTLIIIAHVKDGVDLARKHGLSEPLIDFIEQHHGTTLVQYFFDRANRLSEADPDAGEVDESSFRYPGPKPQTKEAGVMMLADAVESASRTLEEPTPARIQSLVEDISMAKLLDGQFDESGLTLKDIKTIEDSLVKSMNAVYHSRVKYPESTTTKASAVKEELTKKTESEKERAAG